VTGGKEIDEKRETGDGRRDSGEDEGFAEMFRGDQQQRQRDQKKKDKTKKVGRVEMRASGKDVPHSCRSAMGTFA
jgi:hypothetical protein